MDTEKPDRRLGCIVMLVGTAIAWALIVVVALIFWREATPRETAVRRCIAHADGAPSRVAECWSKR